MSGQVSQTESWLERLLAQLGGDSILVRVAAVGVVLLLTVALLWLLRRIGRWLDRVVRSWQGTRLRAIRLDQQEILSEQDTTNIVRGLVRWVRYIGYVFVLYLGLQFITLIFPGTRGMGSDVLAYLLRILGGIGSAILAYLPSLFFLVVLFYVTSRIVKLLHLVFHGIATGRVRISGFHRDWAEPTFKIVRGMVWVLFIIVAFPYLPAADSPAFRGVSVFLGVLFSLGGMGAIANVIGGTVITYMRPFQIGDRVRIADAEGDVVERTMFVTRVRTPKNVVVTIPNSIVMNNPIINYSAEAATRGVTLHTTVTIGYGVPWPRVHKLLVEAAKETEGLEATPEPFVLQRSLDDFTVAYELNATTRDPGRMAAIYSALHAHIQDRFHAAGVEIASPQIVAVRDGNRVNIPDDYLPKNYEPGGFRLLPGLREIRRKEV